MRLEMDEGVVYGGRKLSGESNSRCAKLHPAGYRYVQPASYVRIDSLYLIQYLSYPEVSRSPEIYAGVRSSS